MRNTNPALAQAYALDRQGRLAEAIAAYQNLLAGEPRNSDALHLLGVAMARSGRAAEGARAISAAVELQPDNPSIQVNLGNVLNEMGRHAEAVDHFARALRLKPDMVAAAHAQGRTLMLLGRLEDALQALAAADRLAPGNSNIRSDLGVVLQRLGRSQEALRQLTSATDINPAHVDALHNRAQVEIALGRLPEALQSLDRALNVQPRSAALYAARGDVLSDLGRASEALASYDRALALQPADAHTLRNRGRTLMTLQRLDEALGAFEAAIRVRDDEVDSHFQRGVVLAKLGRHADALTSFDRALQLNPGAGAILNNHAIALAELNRPEEAADEFTAALAADPTNLEALENAANTARVLQRYRDAAQLFDRALALEPGKPQLRLSKGLLLLTLGEYQEGWPLHEARLEVAQLRPMQPDGQTPPLPSIDSLRGTSVLVHAEQGLGDTLQFCRYVPMLEARGVQVTFAVQPPLQLLMRSLSESVQILPYDQPFPALGNRLPLLSLPLLFETRVQNVPAPVPYLSARADARTGWREKLRALPGLKVGMAWQGNLETEKQGGFRGRSFALAELAPLSDLPNVTLISLQKGAGARQRAEVSFGSRVLELTDPDYLGAEEVLDTAALVQELDLVVTSDTVTAHLAGALGVPVWVALSTSPDWRWLTEREDTPWYPNMRLFRQRSRGEWAPVFERIATDLAGLHGRPS
jgi:tetratricopeptide (TPR) repeat protein